MEACTRRKRFQARKAFAHRDFYTRGLLLFSCTRGLLLFSCTDAFTHWGYYYYAKTLLRTKGVCSQNALDHRCFYTKLPIHAHTHCCFFIHADFFSRKQRVYTATFLHAGIVTHRKAQKAFTRTSLYTRNAFAYDVSTYRRCYTQKHAWHGSSQNMRFGWCILPLDPQGNAHATARHSTVWRK